MFTIRDLQLEPGRFHYITDLKFLSHASVTTLYSINLGHRVVGLVLTKYSSALHVPLHCIRVGAYQAAPTRAYLTTVGLCAYT